MTLETALGTIEAARTHTELFGSDPVAVYRKLAKICHPDKVHDPKLKRRSELAFAKLSELYKNDGKSPDAGTVKVGPWTILQPLVSGSISNLYVVSGTSTSAVLKIAKHHDNNQLLDNERRSIKAIRALTLEKGGSTYGKYFPSIHDSFVASGRETNVISYHANGYTLEYIKSQFPGGIPFRHIVWMTNRALSAIGFAHRATIIHGAILPHHLIYLPVNHGLVIVDWTCSVGVGDGNHIPIKYTNWQKHYPREVDKKIAIPSTDIFMLMKAMQWASDRIPSRFLPFFELCFLESPKARPDDAWKLQDKWKKLAEEEYGPPSFVELNINSH